MHRKMHWPASQPAKHVRIDMEDERLARQAARPPALLSGPLDSGQRARNKWPGGLLAPSAGARPVNINKEPLGRPAIGANDCAHAHSNERARPVGGELESE